jgi:RNA ligase
MIDFINLQKMIDEKYISVQKHPSADLYIYNYTQKAQFDRVWNNETLQCRGLIMDSRNNIVARPFPKFFNLQEAIDQGEQLPAEDFVVTEKMDGSLGILYFISGFPHLATRGSFISDQAIRGTKILQSKYFESRFNPHYTYLFEIIYPENRIVVDYKGLEDLVLLAVRDTQTGKEPPYDFICKFAENHGLKHVQKYDAIRDFSKIQAEENKEGYVINFPTSEKRYKIKFDEYVRLHRLVTGVNARTIWDLLRSNQAFDELMDRVPDEFYSWVKKTKKNLEEEFNLVEALALKQWEIIKTLPDRKTQALTLLNNTKEEQKKIIPIVFALLDKKPYADIIWKMLKPSAEKPFKEDVDA